MARPKPLLPYQEPPFTPFDRIALAQLAARIASADCRLAEIGSWTGLGSTRTLLEALRGTHNASLLCVDNWQGADSVPEMRRAATEYDVFATFNENVRPFADRTEVLCFSGGSLSAATLIADACFDLVFIDADHSYDGVRRDIEAWLPKVRPGGILCGHDCETRPNDAIRALLQAGKDHDVVEAPSGANFRLYHCGVILAVEELLSGRATLYADKPIMADNVQGRSSIWYVNI